MDEEVAHLVKRHGVIIDIRQSTKSFVITAILKDAQQEAKAAFRTNNLTVMRQAVCLAGHPVALLLDGLWLRDIELQEGGKQLGVRLSPAYLEDRFVHEDGGE